MMRSVVVSMVLIPIVLSVPMPNGPGASGGRGVGAIWGSAEGAALRRFGCEWITPSWDALSSFAHPTCQASAEVFSGAKPGLPLWGRTSASAEGRHWFGRAVRWSSRAILLSHGPGVPADITGSRYRSER
jgi:hypothetical protein